MVVLVLLYLMWALLVEVVLWWVAQLYKKMHSITDYFSHGIFL